MVYATLPYISATVNPDGKDWIVVCLIAQENQTVLIEGFVMPPHSHLSVRTVKQVGWDQIVTRLACMVYNNQ